MGTAQQLLIYGSAVASFPAGLVFLGHFDGANGATTYADATGRHTLTNIAGAALSTAQFKFGTASLKGDGSTSAVTISSDSDFTFGTGNWTINCWIRPDSSDMSSVASLVDFRPLGVNGDYPALRLSASSNICYEVNNIPRIVSATNSLTANVWQHIEISRVSSTTYLFIAGALQGTWPDSQNYVIGQPRLLRNSGGSTAMLGYLDEVAIFKGNGLHSATFTPPAAPY